MTPAEAYHVPVLAERAVGFLLTDPDGVYVDCTLGGGGHAALICKELSSRGLLIGCDRDGDAIAHSRSVLPASAVLVQCRFSEIQDSLKPHLKGDRVSGFLMDLGVSSFQLDTGERGFSHRASAPLDLRMDPRSGETAAELLARLDYPDLARLIREYGEDPQAGRIAKAILRERERQPITTTDELAGIISKSVAATRNKSLARVFQALRIAVNNELGELSKGLQAAWDLLKPGGRIVVISYHSLEDRMVKNFFQKLVEPERDAAGLFLTQKHPAGQLPFKKPIVPDESEIEENPRARSAKLRVVERLKDEGRGPLFDIVKIRADDTRSETGG